MHQRRHLTPDQDGAGIVVVAVEGLGTVDEGVEMTSSAR
jgi:hypothetical protein